MNKYPKEVFSDDESDNGTMPGNVEELSRHVVGHRIVSIEQNVQVLSEYGYYQRTATVITLDNGKQVLLEDSDDCCAYTEMQDVVLNLDKIDHAITGVGTTDGYTTWHIYADLGDVVELKVGWSSGNPFYYGYGFNILVKDILTEEP